MSDELKANLPQLIAGSAAAVTAAESVGRRSAMAERTVMVKAGRI